MQNHATNSDELNTIKDNNISDKELTSSPQLTLQIPLDDTSRKIRGHEDCADDTDIFTAWLFGLIEALSVRKGYCYMQDKAFALKLKCSERKIQESLKLLEDKRWIYRNTYNTPKGRIRHIICKFLYYDYWDRFLCRPCIPQKVKADFANHAHPQTPAKHPPAEEPTAKYCKSIHAVAKSCESLLFHNTEDYNENNNDAASSFSLLLKDELSKSGISEVEQDAALKYFGEHKEMLMKKDNPVAYIIQGINDGWILEKVQTAQVVSQEASEREETWSGNEVEANGFYEMYHPLERGFKIVIDKFMIQLSFNGSSIPLGFRDTQFRNKLSKMRIKCDESIQHSRKTDTLDES